MRSGEFEFLRMDAGERREFPAAELADWIDAGIGEDWRAQVFYRRVKILARSIRATFEEVMAELRADAEALLAEQPPHPGKVAPVLRGRQVALVWPMLRRPLQPRDPDQDPNPLKLSERVDQRAG